jgi:UDP-glucose 4-epimerase
MVALEGMKQKKVLVTGGAGFIGSATAHYLSGRGYQVFIVDDLSSGHLDAAPKGCEVLVGDFADASLLAQLPQIDACFHFAGLINSAESVVQESRYLETNLDKSQILLDFLVQRGVDRVVFSSSCSVYESANEKLQESSKLGPITPYAKSKLAFEQVLGEYSSLGKIEAVILRYFNAAGSYLGIGERHEPESHLIPIAVDCALSDSSKMSIFGDDYETPDGTCVRDYVHVLDLAIAHEKAMGIALEDGMITANLGTGTGYSNLEIIRMIEEITEKKVEYQLVSRRSGDAPSLVADATFAQTVLNWKADNSSLKQIIEDTVASRK